MLLFFADVPVTGRLFLREVDPATRSWSTVESDRARHSHGALSSPRGRLTGGPTGPLTGGLRSGYVRTGDYKSLARGRRAASAIKTDCFGKIAGVADYIRPGPPV